MDKLSMITINESAIVQDERVKWCMSNLDDLFNKDITYNIDENNRLIITCDTLVIDDEIEELPIKIDEVYGSIILKNTIRKRPGYFKSLKNMPDIIHGRFDISLNENITSLEGGPSYVDGTYWIMSCGLTNLDHIATHISGGLLVSYNHINNVEALDRCSILGVIDLLGNPINSYTKKIAANKLKHICK